MRAVGRLRVSWLAALALGRLRVSWLAALAALGSASCTAPAPTVVVYVSAGPDVAEWIGDAFRDAHPEETLRVEALPGRTALERLRAEASAPLADVWLGAPSWLLATAAAEGLLAPAPPSWAGGVPDDMRDAQGRWTGWAADPMVPAFNSERIARGRAPRDWIVVLHPRWMQDMLLPDPRGSEAMEAFIGTRVARATTPAGDDTPGFDWLARLDAARTAYVTDQEELVRRLGMGEVTLALLPVSAVQVAKERGRSVDFRAPESGSPTLVRGVAAVAGGPHPSGGGTFLTWLGTDQARTALAQRFAYLPAVSAPADGEPAWLTEVRPLFRFDVVPADTLAARLDGWLSRWRDEVMARTNLNF